ncbi:MAG: phytanoyl-CoA dioxygenase family protein [Pseudomonadota bacterium]
MSGTAAEVQELGVVWVRGCLNTDDIERLRAELFGEAVGARIAVNTLKSHHIWGVIRERFPNHTPVRAVTFSRSETQSWSLPWHQDRVIALKERHEVHGFDKWTRKAGIWHCEAPLEYLDRMIFLRVFLDDVDAARGGMAYAIGSHREGLVAQSTAERVAQRCECAVEEARTGDILALPMLTLHRSGTADRPGMRRVLRIDLSEAPLPAPLTWAD